MPAVRDSVALIVADGGASSCRLAAFAEDGRRLATRRLDKHASLTLSEAEAWQHLSEGIDQLMENAGSTKRYPVVLVCGLAGALQSERRNRFLACVKKAAGEHCRCHVVTDGHAQLIGAAGARPGVCLAMGTGSVVHWQDAEGGFGMAGGWGYPIGDEGSGAWLGANALQRYLWQRDGEDIESTLLVDVADRVGSSVSAIQHWTIDARSTKHASLAPLIVEHAKRGDALARQLMEAGAACCERLVRRAPDALPLYVVGGLAAAYRPWLSARLDRRLAEPFGDALDGLYAIARSSMSAD